MHGNNLGGWWEVKYLNLKEPELSCSKPARLNTADLRSEVLKSCNVSEVLSNFGSGSLLHL